MANRYCTSTQRSGETVGRGADESTEQDTALLVKAVLAHRPELFASEVQQLCFCGDLYAAEAYGRRLSRVTYEASVYGPYSEEIESALEALTESKDVLTKPALRSGRRNEKYVLADRPESAADDILSRLSEARVEIVCHVCEVTPSDTDRLEKLVVKSRPYTAASGGEETRFENSTGEGAPSLPTDVHLDIDETELLPLS